MSNVIIQGNPDRKKLLEGLRQELKTFNDVFETELTDQQDILIAASLYKFLVQFKDAGSQTKAKVKTKWTGRAWLFIFCSIPFLLVPWMLFNLFLNSKINKAKRVIIRTLKEKGDNTHAAA